MNKTRIEWVKNPDGTQGYSWNPISGFCPVACKTPDGKIYCYGRTYYNRFQPFKTNPSFHTPAYVKGLEEMDGARKPRGIFLCSLFDVFHPITNQLFGHLDNITWRDLIFDAIKTNPQHRFYVLTKLPQNIDRDMPDNVHLGVSITKNEDIWRRNRLITTGAKIKFISFEPLLEDLDFTLYQGINWIVIGKLTQHGHKYDPKLSWIKKIVRNCADYGIRVFLKDNLRNIWGDNLIQEFPE